MPFVGFFRLVSISVIVFCEFSVGFWFWSPSLHVWHENETFAASWNPLKTFGTIVGDPVTLNCGCLFCLLP